MNAEHERNLLISGIGPGAAVVTGAAVVGAVIKNEKEKHKHYYGVHGFSKVGKHT